MQKVKNQVPIVFTPDTLESHLKNMSNDKEREMFLKEFWQNVLIICES